MNSGMNNPKQQTQPPFAEMNALVAVFNAGHFAEAENRARSLLEVYPDGGHVWKLLAISLHMQGKDALSALQKTAYLLPDDAGAHNNLGTALHNLGQLDDAVAAYHRAVKLKPDLVLAHNNLGNALMDLRQYQGALDSYRRALDLNPGFSDTHFNIGVSLQSLGRLDGAVAAYRRTVELRPDLAEAHSNLGNALTELGQLDAAVANCRRAVELKPGLVEAHNNLGNALKELGKLDAAEASYRNAIKLKPDFALAHSNLGNVLKELGQLDAALASCRRAVELKPDLAEAHSNLGNALQELGQLDAALASYRNAIKLKPDFALAHCNLGHVLRVLGHPDAALASCQRALEIKPDYAEAHNNLGNAQNELGDIDAALASYRQALDLKPDYVDAQTNLLFAMSYTAHSPGYCLEEARKYGRIVAGKVGARFSAWQCAAQPERLRVGLVSGDIRSHVVGYFLEGLLAHIDPSRIELIVYPTQRTEDEFTARIRSYISAWKPLLGLSDEAAARLIHADGVHILLDLSGHTTHNRLPVFAWKPAPVQASWLGYSATTGVAEMDYLLADKVGVPHAQQQQFTESIWYLPDTRLCFTAPEVDLPVASLPATKNGYITFGCFQNLSKIADSVLEAWGKIFLVLPNARLRVQSKQLGEPARVEQLLRRMQHYGIDSTRVVVHRAVRREAYLEAHAEVDMILDTFPYPGGTTTCEALWMGVPTLTLAGDSFLARQGASLLTATGLEEWVATSEEEYIAKAITLGSDRHRLAILRASLRQQVLASPLFDEPRFARNFENALWAMWQNWCDGETVHA